MNIFKLAAIGAILASSSAAFAQDSLTVDPGYYKMDMKGIVGGEVMKEESTEECITSSDNSLTYDQMQEIIGSEFDCRYENTQKSPGMIISNPVCKMTSMEASLTGVSTLTYTNDTVELLFEGNMSAMGNTIPFDTEIKVYKILDVCP